MTGQGSELAEIRRKVRVGSAERSALGSWLVEACQDPERFRKELFQHCLEKRGGMLKSRLNGGYDLYHDIVLAHADRRRSALAWQGERGNGSLSFAEVHKAASDLAAAWSSQGAEPGAAVCIVQDRDGQWPLAVLAALQMGMVVSLVSCGGPTLLRRQVVALGADFAVAPEALARELAPIPARILRARSTPSSRSWPGSYAYDEGAAAFRLLSPFADGIVDVPAGLAHHALLRDSELVFTFDASDVVAAPGWDAYDGQPFLFLAALMAGAAWVELGVEALEAEPGVFERHGVTIAGIGATARDYVLRHGTEPPARSWFYDLTHALNVDRWGSLAKWMAAKQVPGFGVVITPASAGALLFGLSETSFSLNVWPVPGMSFELTEIGAGELVAHGDVGCLLPQLPESASAGVPKLIVSRREDAFTFGGCLELGPDSRRYPADAVTDLVMRRFPGVRHAEIVVTQGRWPNEANVTLILFVKAPSDGIAGAQIDLGVVQKTIEEEIGARWIPNRFEVYPLEPRFVSGLVDSEYCRSQYLSGALTAKARKEVFVLLSRLRQVFAVSAQTD